MGEPGVRTDARLRLRVREGSVEAEGPAHALIGHVIPIAARPPSGTWVRWAWDGACLSVTRDAMSAHPLFYAVADDGIVVSPSILRIMETGVSRALDLDALAAFAAIGYYLESDTPFRAIRALPVGAALDWRPGHLELTGRPEAFVPLPIARESVIEGLIESVRTAVGRRIPSDAADGYAMPITGGRDSRHLLLELRRQGHPPDLGVTAGHFPSIGGGQDPRRAAALCEVLGIAHRRLAVGRSLVAAEMRKNRVTGYASDEHAWSLAVADALRGRTDHTYDGLGGGSLIKRPWEAYGWQRLAFERRFDELAERLVLGGHGVDRYTDLVAPALRGPLGLARAAARVRAAFEPWEGAADPLFQFRFWNRDMRELALVATLVHAEVPTVYTPYLDPDFVGFVGSVPSGSIDVDVHTEAIARAYPEVARVRYARFEGPAVSRPLARRINADLARILLRVSDGSLVDRRGLLRRALRGSVSGDTSLVKGRRPAIVTYLVQLERLVRDGA